jgi:hypothetical protein
MADYDLTSLDEMKPDGQVDQVLVLDDAEQETRRKLKGWADVEHSLANGRHTIVVSVTAPTPPTAWQLWFNSDTGELLIYHDDLDKWVTVEQPTFNYLYNPGFSRFNNVNTIPTGWSWYGSSTTGTLVPAGTGMTDTHQKFGSYALAINSGNGDLTAFQRLGKAGSTFAPIDYWKNRTISLGCWVWTATPSKALIYIEAPPSSAVSPYHPGDGTWRWLVAVLKVPNDVGLTDITLQLRVTGASVTAIFSGPTLVDGSWCPHVLPSGLFLRSEVLHLGSSAGVADTVPGGTIYYGAQGGNANDILGLTVAPFDCIISNLRVYIPSAPGAGQNYVSTLYVSRADTPMTCTIADTNTFNIDNTNKLQVTAGTSISLKVVGSTTATISTVRASVLIEEIPAAIL